MTNLPDFASVFTSRSGAPAAGIDAVRVPLDDARALLAQAFGAPVRLPGIEALLDWVETRP